jgi:hypothetical protein
MGLAATVNNVVNRSRLSFLLSGKERVITMTKVQYFFLVIRKLFSKF